jgi:hypothetical protein
MDLIEQERIRNEHNESESEYGKIDASQPQSHGANEKGETETGHTANGDNYRERQRLPYDG